MGPDKGKLVEHKCKSCDADLTQDSQPHICVSIQPEVVAVDPMIGKTIHERYRILEALSAGGWSKVYLAQHMSLGTKVALKVLNTDLTEQEDKRKRFEFEAQCASKLDHPNIGRIFDYGLFEGRRPFIVMELLSGSTLAEYLSEKGGMKPDEFKSIFSQLISGIEAAHASSLVHRDLKPSNVMFANSNFQDLKVKILDFGIAKSVDPSPEASTSSHLTSTGEILGTPAYMSPEQIAGRRVDQRSDIYSLACMMYECASGKRPFEALNSFEVMVKHCQEQPKSVAALLAEKKYPSKLNSFILRCLEKNPEERFSDAKEMLEAFDQVWQGTYSGKFPRAVKKQSVSKVLLPICVAAIAVTALTVYFVQHQNARTQTTPLPAVAAVKPPVPTELEDEPPEPKKSSKQKTFDTVMLELIQKQGGPENTLRYLNGMKQTNETEDEKILTDVQIAKLYELSGHEADARKLYENAVARVSKVAGANSPKMLQLLALLRRNYIEAGDYAKAQNVDSHRLKILESSGINDQEQKSMAILQLVEDCLYQTKMEEASAYLNSAELVIYARSDKVPKLQEAYSFSLKAHQSFRMHQNQDASSLASKAFESASNATTSEFAAEVLELTSLIYDEIKDRKMVGLCLRKAVQARRAANDKGSDEMIADSLKVAQNYSKRRISEGVIRYLKVFPQIAELRPGPPSPELAAGLTLYVKTLNDTGKTKEAQSVEKQFEKLKQRPKVQLPAV